MTHLELFLCIGEAVLLIVLISTLNLIRVELSRIRNIIDWAACEIKKDKPDQ